MAKALYRTVCLLAVFASAAAQSPCTYTDPNTGSMYDLSRLQGASDYLIDAPGQSWTFATNLCTPPTNVACPNNAGVCQLFGGDLGLSIGGYPPVFSSLAGSCGIEHDGYDWGGENLPGAPFYAPTAGQCCLLCGNIGGNMYVWVPSTTSCWCKNINSEVVPFANPDRVFGRIGTENFAGQGLIATYRGGDAGRTAVIYLHCNTTAGRGAPKYLREGPILYYYFIWESQYACSTGNGQIMTTGAVNPPMQLVTYNCQPTITLQNGRTYSFDFSRLRKDGSDYIAQDDRGYVYLVNMCRTINSNACGQGSGVCQEAPTAENPNRAFSTGQVSSNTPTWGPLPTYYLENNFVGAAAQFSGGAGGRSATILLICGASQSVGAPAFVGEAPTLDYDFIWYTGYACPTNAPPPPPSVTTQAYPVTTWSTQFHDVANQWSYDISSLRNDNGDYITYDQNQRSYYINIGRTILRTECGPQSSSCQMFPLGGGLSAGGVNPLYSPLSGLDSQGKGFRLVLDGGLDGRKSIITFTCSPETIGRPVFLHEDTILDYEFAWSSSAACGAPATGDCGMQTGHDFPHYDSPRSPYKTTGWAACCAQCQTLAGINAYVYAPSSQNCWCKSLDLASVPSPANDRIFGRITPAVSPVTTTSGSATSSPSTTPGSSSSGMSGREAFFMVGFILMAIGVVGYFGYSYYKKRQGSGNEFRFSPMRGDNVLHLDDEK